MNVTINIETKENTYAFTISEAKDLYDELNKLFGNKNYGIFPTIYKPKNPYYPYPDPVIYSTTKIADFDLSELKIRT